MNGEEGLSRVVVVWSGLGRGWGSLADMNEGQG